MHTEPARFDYPMANVSSRRNDAVTLSCLAKGDDPINILWSHNGSRIDLNNYRYTNEAIKGMREPSLFYWLPVSVKMSYMQSVCVLIVFLLLFSANVCFILIPPLPLLL